MLLKGFIERFFLFLRPGFYFTDTDGSQCSREMEGTMLITFYHFQPPTSMKISIFIYASEISSLCF